MGDLLILGTRKGLLQYERHNGAWRYKSESFRAQPVSYAIRDPRTGTLWAGLDHGHWGQKLHRSDDVGATWQEVPVPVFPDGAVQSVGFPGGDRRETPAKVSYIWIIQPGGADQPNRLYIGTEPGGLFRSDDGGETFELVQSLWDRPERSEWWFGGGRDHPGLCSICVDPRDSTHIVVGISCGGVYETHDDGATWHPRNSGLYADFLPDPTSEFGHDPHFMVMSPSNPDVLWQQNHCGVFRSVDSGKTWKNISQPDAPAYFGFPIAVDAHNANTAWVVPAIDSEFRIAVDRALCVCRTDDGGSTWTALRNGLPQGAAFDVVFRHALDLSGDTLAFGTTTGNLYLSSDRGESWQCLGGNLPPIHSVRFASA